MDCFGTIFKETTLEKIENIIDYNFEDPSILNYIFANLETPQHNNLVKSGQEALAIMLEKFNLKASIHKQIEAGIVKAVNAYRFDLIYEPNDIGTRTSKINFWYALMGGIAVDSKWDINKISQSFLLLFNINFNSCDKFEYISKISTHLYYYFLEVISFKFIKVNDKISRLQCVFKYQDGNQDYTINASGKDLLSARNNGCLQLYYKLGKLGIL